jgi:hypothetical protein
MTGGVFGFDVLQKKCASVKHRNKIRPSYLVCSEAHNCVYSLVLPLVSP